MIDSMLKFEFIQYQVANISVWSISCMETKIFLVGPTCDPTHMLQYMASTKEACWNLRFDYVSQESVDKDWICLIRYALK